MKKELQITKDNYKGYTELFLAQKLDKKECEKIWKAWKSIALGILSGSIVFPFLPSVGWILMALGTWKSFCLLIECEVSSYKRIKHVKKKYPYINIYISKKNLKQLLQKAKILDQNDAIISTLEYEDYLKCEEIKKDVIQSVKKDYSMFKTVEVMNEDALDQVKQKVKQYIRKHEQYGK